MQTSHVDPATIHVWRWQALIMTLCLAAGAVIFSLQHDPIWLILPICIAVLGLVLSWLWPPLYYRHLQYGVDETGICIYRGVLWRSRITLPRARIQHTDVSQGPLQRHFDVGTLKLYTAGNEYTEIKLPGLTYDKATSLRDALLAEDRISGV